MRRTWIVYAFLLATFVAEALHRMAVESYRAECITPAGDPMSFFEAFVIAFPICGAICYVIRAWFARRAPFA